jgi:hypothetical protein
MPTAMTDPTQIAAIVVSVALLVLVLELVRRRRLTEEYSLLWFVCATALLVFSVWRDALHLAARLLGVHYPPAVLILVLVLFVFVVSLYFSVVVSRQRQQIEHLVEELALMDADLRGLARTVHEGPNRLPSGGRTGSVEAGASETVPDTGAV